MIIVLIATRIHGKEPVIPPNNVPVPTCACLLLISLHSNHHACTQLASEASYSWAVTRAKRKGTVEEHGTVVILAPLANARRYE
jgi:hypothetical protein